MLGWNGLKFSWFWAAIELGFLLLAWALYLLGVWPRIALIVTAVVVTAALLQEIRSFYRGKGSA